MADNTLNQESVDKLNELLGGQLRNAGVQVDNTTPKFEALQGSQQAIELEARARAKSGKNLRYPFEQHSGTTQDYIHFSSFIYRRGTGKDIANPVSLDPYSGQPSNPNASPTLSTGPLVSPPRRGNGPAPNDLIKTGDTIILPIPGQISDTNAVNYGESSLNNYYAAGLTSIMNIQDAGGPGALFQTLGNQTGNWFELVKQDTNLQQLIKAFSAQQAISALGANISLEQLFARATGSIINPNMELLFNGPTLRQFKFQFKFTPRFQREAQEVKSIIRSFKTSMSPIGKDQNFLRTPNIFQVQYVGASSNYLNKFKLCALTNMSVNYTGEGNYATYSDGSPVSMIMDLAFQELEPIYAEDYKGVGGVGY